MPTDCFETLPFPANYEINPAAEVAGKTYYEFRADVMVRNNEGITKTYNRFHRPDEYSPDILKLRELHDAMDRAVLDAYGWHDLQPVCEFFPEFDDEDDEESESAAEALSLSPARRRPRRSPGALTGTQPGARRHPRRARCRSAKTSPKVGPPQEGCASRSVQAVLTPVRRSAMLDHRRPDFPDFRQSNLYGYTC